MIHAWIVFELNNGVQIKYVRNILNDTNGMAKEYYGYTGEVLVDDFDEQDASAGQVKKDYADLLTLFGNGSVVQEFPESTGNTSILQRHNKSHGIGDIVDIYTTIIKATIARIYIVEQWVPTGRELTSEALPILPII